MNNKAILSVIICLAISTQISTQSKFIPRDKSHSTSTDIQRKQIETVKKFQLKP